MCVCVGHIGGGRVRAPARGVVLARAGRWMRRREWAVPQATPPQPVGLCHRPRPPGAVCAAVGLRGGLGGGRDAREQQRNDPSMICARTTPQMPVSSPCRLGSWREPRHEVLALFWTAARSIHVPCHCAQDEVGVGCVLYTAAGHGKHRKCARRVPPPSFLGKMRCHCSPSCRYRSLTAGVWSGGVAGARMGCEYAKNGRFWRAWFLGEEMERQSHLKWPIWPGRWPG